MGDWRNYVEGDAYFVDETQHNAKGSDLTITARGALDKATDEIVKTWLANKPVIETALQLVGTYDGSANRALARAIQRFGNDRYEPWVKINGAVQVHRMRLAPNVEQALRTYAIHLLAAEQANENITRVLEEDRWFHQYEWKTITREEVNSS